MKTYEVNFLQDHRIRLELLGIHSFEELDEGSPMDVLCGWDDFLCCCFCQKENPADGLELHIMFGLVCSHRFQVILLKKRDIESNMVLQII